MQSNSSDTLSWQEILGTACLWSIFRSHLRPETINNPNQSIAPAWNLHASWVRFRTADRCSGNSVDNRISYCSPWIDNLPSASSRSANSPMTSIQFIVSPNVSQSFSALRPPVSSYEPNRHILPGANFRRTNNSIYSHYIGRYLVNRRAALLNLLGDWPQAKSMWRTFWMQKLS